MDTSILPKPKLPKKQNLSYDLAMLELDQGYMIKLPEWTGFWFKAPAQQGERILVFTADCQILDTPHLEDYRNRTDWETTDGARDIGGAIRAMDAGCLVSRNPESGEFITKQIPSEVQTDVLPFMQSLCGDAKKRVIAAQKPLIFSDAQFLIIDKDNRARYWIPDVLDLTAKDYFIV